MATLQAATTSTGAIVSNPQAVRELCENYCFGTPRLGGHGGGRAHYLGCDDFEVYEARESGLPDYEGGIVTHEFLRSLADHLEPNEEFDIQTAGFTKCRFPVLAKRYVVRDGEVLHADLSSPTRSTSSVVRPRGVRGDTAQASPRKVIESWDTAHLLRTNVPMASTRSTTLTGVLQT